MAARPSPLVVVALLVAAPSLAADEPPPLLFHSTPDRVRPGGEAGWALAVSPDGKTVATGHGELGGAGRLRLWDRGTGRVRHTVAEPNGTRGVAFSPDGTLVATANFDGTVRLYDAASAALRASGRHAGRDGTAVALAAVAFAPDGRHVFTAGFRGDAVVRAWAVDTGGKADLAPVAVFNGHKDRVTGVAVSPDGRTLYTSSHDKSVRAWDVPDPLPAGGKPVEVKAERRVFATFDKGVESVAASADGRFVAAASWEGITRVWDADGKPVGTPSKMSATIHALSFSRDGKYLVAAAATGGAGPPTSDAARVWRAAGWQPLPFRDAHAGGAKGAGFLPDNRTVVVAGEGGEVHLTDVTAAGENVVTWRDAGAVAPPDSPLLAVAVAPDGSLAAVAGEGKDVFVFAPAGKGTPFALAGHDDVVTALAWSGDGKTLASASQDRTLKLWDIAGRKELRTLKGHTGWVYGVAWSPDGKQLASAGYDKTVRLWDAATGELKATWKEHSAGVRAVAWSGDGKTLASGGADRTVRVWDAGSGHVRFTLKGHKGAVRSVAFAPDGATVASGGEDRTVRVWDTTTGKERHALAGHPDMVTAVRFSPTGTTLAAGTFSGPVVAWNPLSGRKRQALATGGEPVFGEAFLPDGRLLTVGQDKVIRLWSHAPTLESAAAVAHVGGPAVAVALSPDGTAAVAGLADGKLVVVDPATGTVGRTVPAAVGGITRVDWSAAGDRLAVCGDIGTVAVHDAKTGAETGRFPGRFAAYSPDGTKLAVADKSEVVVVDAAAGRPLFKLAGEAVCVAWDGTGKWLATAGADHVVRLWAAADGAKGAVYPPFRNSETVVGLAFSPDGTKLAVAANSPDAPPTADDADEFQVSRGVWTLPVPAAGGAAPTALPPPRRLGFDATEITGVGWTADGERLVTTAADGIVRDFVPDKRDGPAPTRRHRAAVLAMAWQPDTATLLTASEDGTVRRWAMPGGPSRATTAARLFDPLGKPVWAADYGPDGKTFVTGGLDRTLRFHSPPPAPKPVFAASLTTVVSDVAVTPDGKTVFTAQGGDGIPGEVALWAADTGKPLGRLPAAHARRVWAVAVSPDGKTCVSAGGSDNANDKTGEGFLYALDGGRKPRPLEDVAVGNKIRSVAFSPDGKQVAAACGDGTVRLWDAETGRAVRTLGKHTRGARRVAWTPDGAMVISSGFDVFVRVWDAAGGEPVRAWKVTDGWPMEVAVSPDGHDVAVAVRANPDKDPNAPGVVLVYPLDGAGKPREFKGHGGGAMTVAFLPDGKTLVSAGGTEKGGELFVWDFATGKPVAEFRGLRHQVMGTAISPDGRTLFTGGAGKKGGEVVSWDTRGLRSTAAATAVVSGMHVGATAHSPDGKTLVAVGGSQVSVLDLSDPLKPRKKATLAGHKDALRTAAFSPDGTRFATGDGEGVVIVWDAGTLQPVATWKASELSVYRVVFSPDGKTLATAAGDYKTKSHGEVRFWEPATGVEVGRLPNQSREVWAVEYLDGGRQVVTAQAVAGKPGDAPIKVWDAATHKEVKAIADGFKGSRCMAVSPDGRRVAVGSHAGLVKVYDATTWQEVATPSETGKCVFKLAFSPDGLSLAAAHEDGNATITRLPPVARK